MLLDTASLERLRFWTVGSLASADPATVPPGAAVHRGRPAGRPGAGPPAERPRARRRRRRGRWAPDPALIRAAVIVAVTLLCGAATAACGPIVFVGLLVPHLVRALTGPDLRWLLPYCAVLAPVLLLGADVLGRVLGRPGELQVGMVTAVLGGPLFLLASCVTPRAGRVRGHDRSADPRRLVAAASAPRRWPSGSAARCSRWRRWSSPSAAATTRWPRPTCCAPWPAAAPPAEDFIVRELRLPRLVTALLVGAALALAGAVFQSLVRNPLGSPDMLGFTQGAPTGACSWWSLGGSSLALAGAAVVGGLATGLLIYAARLAARRARLPADPGRHRHRRDPHRRQRLPADPGPADGRRPGGALAHRQPRRAGLGQRGAAAGRPGGAGAAGAAGLRPGAADDRVGRRHRQRPRRAASSGLRLVLLAAAVLLVSFAAAAAGPVSFVALTAPHLARRLTRAPGPNLLPSMASARRCWSPPTWLAQRAFTGHQLPVGVVTGVHRRRLPGLAAGHRTPGGPAVTPATPRRGTEHPDDGARQSRLERHRADPRLRQADHRRAT